jgi:hypothetical protein
MPCGQTINSDLYVQNLKTLQKHLKRVWPTETWLQSYCNMTMRECEVITKFRLLFPTHHIPQILLPQTAISLEPSKMPVMGRGLEVITKLLKKWQWVQNSNWHKKGITAHFS